MVCCQPTETPRERATCWCKTTTFCRVSSRGIIGVLVPLIFASLHSANWPRDTVAVIWFTMFWFFLMQPVAIPVTGLMPLFIYPLFSLMGSDNVSLFYSCETISLFVIGSMVALLMNSTGVDRRIAYECLGTGTCCQYTPKRLLMKSCITAFFLSMLCSRLIVTKIIMEFLMPGFERLMSKRQNEKKAAAGRSAPMPPPDPSLVRLKDVVFNAVQVSATLGSLVFVHGATTVLAFKAIWLERFTKVPDIFNYLQYFCFIFPPVAIMFILCYGYFNALVASKRFALSKPDSEVLRESAEAKRKALPRIQRCEEVSVVIMIVILFFLCLRWTVWFDFIYGAETIQDSTIMAFALILLHIIPNSLHFVRIFTVNSREALGDPKPASGFIWWRFIDRNTNYGYIFLFGAGKALHWGVEHVDLDRRALYYFQWLFEHHWWMSSFFVILWATCSANIMSGTAACVVFMPLVMATYYEPFGDYMWARHSHHACLAVGVATAFGYCVPFLYTPAWYCKYIGKMKLMTQIKICVPAVLICIIILWLAIVFYAPIIWDLLEVSEST